MIITLSKGEVEKFRKKFDKYPIDGCNIDCGELTKERIDEFLELAIYLNEGKKGAPIKYKVGGISEADVVNLCSYEEDVTTEDAYFAGLMEVPAIALITTRDKGFADALHEVIDSVKFKCDNKSEDLMYATSGESNTYLNVSKNILTKHPQSKLRQKMVTDLENIFKRFDTCEMNFWTLPILPMNDPFKYLYVTQGYGRELADLLDLEFEVPDVAEMYNSTGKLAFEFNGKSMLFIPNHGLIDADGLDVFGEEGSLSEVF